MRRATIERIELKMEDLEAVLARAKATLPPEDYEILRQLVDAYVYVTGKIADERTTIRWLRQLLGSESEKTAKVLERAGLEGSSSSTRFLPAPGLRIRCEPTDESGVLL
jgi:hypothetical protein